MSTDDEVTRGIRLQNDTTMDPEMELLVDLEDAPLASEHDRYERISSLGRGGMGEVLLYKDTRIARQIACKVLRKGLRDNEAFRTRFLLEARLQGQLEHPSIVPVHDLGETRDGDLFFTMKRVRGITLRAALRTIEEGGAKARFSRRRLLTAFSSVCLTMDFAHRRGVVHRDLKPENIMLGDFGEVYVLDWGIAKVMHQTDTPVPIEDGIELPGGMGETPTRLGIVLGTPSYMAPERRTGHADPRTDVYALGVILSEVLAADLATAPPELIGFAARAMAHDPERRYASARELHEAIEQYLDGDRDLEARRKLSGEHAARAEIAFQRSMIMPTSSARVEAGREIGRALGLDPGNTGALRTLMRLLTEVPQQLPPEAQAELDRRWHERRGRTLRSGVGPTLMLLVLIPFIIAMGVRQWGTLLAFSGLVLATAACQWRVASTPRQMIPMFAGLILEMTALAILSSSMGLLGILPGTMAIVTMGYRMYVDRWVHGVAILLTATAALLVPFLLQWYGVIAPMYALRDGAIVLFPTMHDFPPGPTLVYLLVGCVGVVATGLLYGRMYLGQIRRVERELTFHAWQLQQLIPT